MSIHSNKLLAIQISGDSVYLRYEKKIIRIEKSSFAGWVQGFLSAGKHK